MRERSCENCAFIHRNSHGNAKTHECRKNPPAYTTVVKTIWPHVRLDDWCGAFEPTNSKEVGER